MHDVHRLVEAHALAEAEANPAAHQREVQGHDRIAVLGVDLAERVLQPARRLLQRLGDGDDLGAGSFQPGKVGQVGAELAFDNDEPVGLKASDVRAEGAGNLSLADGDAGGAGERQSFGELGAKVGVFPGLDAAMWQSERGIGVDRVDAQIGDPRVAGAGQPLLRRGEQVDKGLLRPRLELLDRKLHAKSLLSGGFAEFGVARLLELERKLRPAGARHAPVGEHMHPVRNDVVQEPLVMGDDEHGAIGTAQRVHALGDDAQGVDVEARIGLVEDAERRIEQRHLQDLVPLLLAAGEADIERTPQHFRVDLQGRSFLAHEAQEVGRGELGLAARLAHGVGGGAQEGHGGDAGYLHRVLEGEEHAGAARSDGSRASRSLPFQVTDPSVTS